MIRDIQAPLPFFEPQSSWVAPDLSALPSWAGARRVSVDIETKDENLRAMGPGFRRPGCYIVGYSFALEDGPSAYVPLRHGGGGNVDVAQGLAYLRAQAAAFDGDICGAGLQYDIDGLAQEKIEFPNVRFFRDVQIAAPLLDENQLSYSLDAIAQREGIPGKDESMLMEALASYGYRDPNAKRGLHALPARLVGPYGEQDARLPLQLLARQERRLEEEDLWRVYDLESRVLPVLVRLRRRGVRVSVERLEGVERWARERQIEAVAEVVRQTGVKIDAVEVTKAESLARVLRAIGIEPPRTKKSNKPSVTAELLLGINHPVGALLRRAREMSQLRSMFCDSIRDHLVVGPDDEARIHCTFNQLRKSKDDEGEDGDTEGVGPGRLSCVKPNLQQQPSPDRKPEYGKMWRSIYLPEKGAIWGQLDYSQQEPRMAIHFGVAAGAQYIGVAAHRAALKAAQTYIDAPATDFHDMMTRMVYGDNVKTTAPPAEYKKLRNFCKQIMLGLSYGMGGAKLCRKLGLPTKMIEGKGGRIFEVAGDDGQAIIDKFNAMVPFIKQTAWVASNIAKKRGYIVTLSGRRCRFPKDEAGNFDWTHKAFNNAVQGSSADQTKTAIVDLDAADIYCQLQVHDEVDGSFESPEQVSRAAKIMEDCLELEVPFRVDAETGPSWGEVA